MLGLHQDQGLGNLGTGQMGEQNTWFFKILPVAVAARFSQASPGALGPSVIEGPLEMRALSLSASASECSSLSVSLSLSPASGRNPVQKLNAHLAAVHPQPFRRSKAAARSGHARSGRKQVSQSLSGAGCARKWQGRGPPGPVMGREAGATADGMVLGARVFDLISLGLGRALRVA